MMLLPPPAILRGRVIALWALKGHAAGRYAGLPKPYAELIVSLSGVHFWQPTQTSPPLVFTDGWLTPVQAGARYAATHGMLHLIGARLDPLAAVQLFGLPASSEIASPLPLDALIGRESERLRTQLIEAESECARLSILAGWLSERLAEGSAGWLPATDRLHLLRWRVDCLADAVGLSPRGLRKRFAEHVGIGPKLWLQLGRFDALLRQQPCRGSLAGLAADFGYADQAHMTAEFSRFAGVTPGRYGFVRETCPAPYEAPHFLPERSKCRKLQ